jgi:hypothetical protein
MAALMFVRALDLTHLVKKPLFETALTPGIHKSKQKTAGPFGFWAVGGIIITKPFLKKRKKKHKFTPKFNFSW